MTYCYVSGLSHSVSNRDIESREKLPWGTTFGGSNPNLRTRKSVEGFSHVLRSMYCHNNKECHNISWVYSAQTKSSVLGNVTANVLRQTHVESILILVLGDFRKLFPEYWV